MVKTSKEYCKKCEYYSGGSDETSGGCCFYIIKTGKRRGCEIGYCDKFEKKKKNVKKEIPWSETSNLLQMMNSKKLMNPTKTLENM
jgi:hypothetical protein